jgi:hypothetical protein
MTPKQFLVVDIPADATAEQAEALLNGASGDYYMRSLNMWPDKSARAIFNRRAAKPEKEE